jgi:anti-sigma B factor antagonist
MRQDIKMDGARHIVKLEGSMYAIDAANLREAIQTLIHSGSKKFLFDLSALDYMDSTGLGLFIYLEDELKGQGGKMEMKGVGGRVKTLFERTRLYDVFTILQ